jgi:hypothetical protein
MIWFAKRSYILKRNAVFWLIVTRSFNISVSGGVLDRMEGV